MHSYLYSWLELVFLCNMYFLLTINVNDDDDDGDDDEQDDDYNDTADDDG